MEMNRVVAPLVALVLASAGTAHAGGSPAHVAPYLTGEEDGVHVVTGAFGAKDTTVVVIFSLRGRGGFSGFALIPDAKAKSGHRKVALPKLPAGAVDGGMRTALVANLDKDPDDELVLGLQVFRNAGGGSYGTWEYVVLDGNGKRFVRLPALENKLARKMTSREDPAKTDELTEADVRDALGAPAKK